MIAEIIPGLYEHGGKRVLQPNKKRYPFFTGRPMGLFLSQPLQIYCRNIDEIRRFLSTCRYVSDMEQFGVKDHWMAPEEFEKARQGDCEDFALWTWRQLLHLGYNARFVAGTSGRYGRGHAWVTFEVGNETFLCEALMARSFREFPRLEVLRYEPRISVEVQGKRVQFLEHSKRTTEPPFLVIAPLLPELVRFRLRILGKWVQWPFRLALYRLRKLRTA